ncbi:MAG: GFA family protein [Gammaproteobacteria bacterium]|nr:GFA family protein [Gammaproteobacteria bacterium]
MSETILTKNTFKQSGFSRKKYRGSCHCGKVVFTVDALIDKIVSCNCSICSKKGALHHRVNPSQFDLVSGEEDLVLYQFDTKEAKHYFCRNCGIHSFSYPRAAPDMVSINVRCLENFSLEREGVQVISFDGRNWEKSLAKLNEELGSNK